MKLLQLKRFVSQNSADGDTQPVIGYRLFVLDHYRSKSAVRSGRR